MGFNILLVNTHINTSLENDIFIELQAGRNQILIYGDCIMIAKLKCKTFDILVQIR